MKKYFVFIFSHLLLSSVQAQENYEIQVYASPTMEKNQTMIELHSNFTFNGSKQIENGVLPTNRMFHETIEITHGVTDWFELGFYLFNAIGDNGRSGFVGSHIRPRVMLPEKYNFPVGLSLSAEFGFQKRRYSEDDWSIEIRPIIDKKFNKLYLAFNPVLEKSLHGENTSHGFEFTPNAKIGFDVTKAIAPGLEYYGNIGVIGHSLPYKYQQHQLFIALDLEVHPDWELNFGYGFGLTGSTDKSIIKCIIGRRINWAKK